MNLDLGWHVPLAYIGPGAGFAALGSFLVVLTAFASAIFTLFTWPFRYTLRAIRGRRALARSRIKRLVVLGLDGMDPLLAEEFMAQGLMPNLSALRDTGCFKRLATTLPPLSPVAWSSFLTGCNPGKHNIFDFLACDRRTYQPKLSSVSIRGPRHTLRMGRYEIPLGKPDIRLLRKSRPFWHDLGRAGVFSSVLRVPITFPPEKMRGVLLSAMCTPDLLGSQGTFSCYTTRSQTSEDYTGGARFTVTREKNAIRSSLVGPENPLRTDHTRLTCYFEIVIQTDGRVSIRVDGQKLILEKGAYSDWVSVSFRAGPGMTIKGICQFLVLSVDPHFEMYVTPIQIDPAKPAMPISHPRVYSHYLARNQGTFATLGLAEDTWGLTAGVLSDQTFLDQCLQADAEREKMFFDSLDKVKRGLCVCVFDGTDRIQHMFWRYLDPNHPAHAGESGSRHRQAIPSLYERMDALVGRTVARCKDPGTVLMVVSDHGFNSFRRGIDLNAWLLENDYLKLKPDARPGKYLQGVDWAQTRAFAIGLAGIYLNVRGREEHGIVEPGAEAAQLRGELVSRLTGLVDSDSGQTAIHRAYESLTAYRGPYKEEAPDIIIGYARGYRVSWEAAVGDVTDRVFHDNLKAWSGDHCIDPSLVPGVLFCSHPIAEDQPRLIDLGPTALELFGVPIPKHVDGRPLTVNVGHGRNGGRSK